MPLCPLCSEKYHSSLDKCPNCYNEFQKVPEDSNQQKKYNKSAKPFNNNKRNNKEVNNNVCSPEEKELIDALQDSLLIKNTRQTKHIFTWNFVKYDFIQGYFIPSWFKEFENTNEKNILDSTMNNKHPPLFEIVKGGKHAVHILSFNINRHQFILKLYNITIEALFCHLLTLDKLDVLKTESESLFKLPKIIGIGLWKIKDINYPFLIAEWIKGDNLQTMLNAGIKPPVKPSQYAKLLSLENIHFDLWLKNFILTETHDIYYIDLLSSPLNKDEQRIMEIYLKELY